MTDQEQPLEPPAVHTFAIEHNALAQTPIWETHTRGRNWLATLTNIDPTAPGGFTRDFWERARGDYFYLLRAQGVRIGDALEFGADYYTGSGGQQRNRWYGVVTAITPEQISLLRCDSPRSAYATGQALIAEHSTVRPDTLDALFDQFLTQLNTTVLEPGQHWYGTRAPAGPAARRNGKLGDWRFRYLTDAAARKAGLLADEATGMPRHTS